MSDDNTRLRRTLRTRVQGGDAVRDDYVPFPSRLVRAAPSGATATRHRPSLRDRIAGPLSGDARQGTVRHDLIRELFGSNGIGAPEFGLVDLTPLGMVFAADEARRASKRGARGTAAITAIGAIPIPGAKVASKAVSKAASVIAKPLPMDQASRMARARSMGFRDNMPLFHGTAADFAEFSPSVAGRTTGARSARSGVWTTPDPRVASEYSKAAASTDTNAGPNILPLLHRTERPGRIQLDGSETDLEVQGTIDDAFARGHDALMLLSTDGRRTVVVKDPAQLRSRFAAFDPAHRDSRNLLAGTAAASVGAGGALAGKLEIDRKAQAERDRRQALADDLRARSARAPR